MPDYVISKGGSELDRDLREGLDNEPKGSAGFDDFDFSVGNLRINPATSKPDYDYNEGEYLFDPATTETVVGTKITKHKFKVGAGVIWRPHVHWIQSQAGVVVWQLEYKMWAANTLEPAWTTVNTIGIDPEFAYASGALHQIQHFPDIDMSSNTSAAVYTKVRISRLGGDAADTYAVDARLMGFDFHAPVDQPAGSRQEFIK